MDDWDDEDVYGAKGAAEPLCDGKKPQVEAAAAVAADGVVDGGADAVIKAANAEQEALIETEETGPTDENPIRPNLTENSEPMAAAAAAEEDAEGEEFQFDSSDAESSDSDTSSDDSSEASDGGSDDNYELLDPATVAKMLMKDDGEDDDAPKNPAKSKEEQYPRTANEIIKEEAFKPDVTITEDTKLTLLGVVQNMVENMILIKGATPGQYQVLESGSVVCNDKREVIGVIADTFGRVQEPLYSVAFNNQDEMEKAGIKHDDKIFYVDDHSTFVFTQPLRNLKGTDASNIHDEEVKEDDMEFSDDEQEALHKREIKERKLANRVDRGDIVGGGGRGGRGGKGGRGGRGGRGAFTRNNNDPDRRPTYDTGRMEYEVPHVSNSDAPVRSSGGGALNYDDDATEDSVGASDGFYNPLKRPDNLHQLQESNPPPPRPSQGFSGGRGGGREHRGHENRGPQRRGRGGDRNGFDQPRGGGRGGNRQYQYPQQHAPTFPGHQTAYSQPSVAHSPAAAYPQHPSTSQHQTPLGPTTYEFNQQTYQYNAQSSVPTSQPQYNSQSNISSNQPQSYDQSGVAANQLQNFGQQPVTAGSIPPGSYINATYYANYPVQDAQQQQPQAGYPTDYTGQNAQQQYQQPYGAWPSQYNQSYGSLASAQDTQIPVTPTSQYNQPQGLQAPTQDTQAPAPSGQVLDISAILRSLGQQQN